jgi:LPS sulfotransferase NodH
MVSRVNFILLGHPRSGSTLLTLALQSHPDIRMFGELFHAEFPMRLRAFGYGIRCRPSQRMSLERTRGWAYTYHQDGGQFLKDLVFGDASDDAPLATGFKFFYDHARVEPRENSAWDYLRQNQDVRIVHIFRRNLFDCLVSIKTAERSKVWEVEVDDPLPPVLSPFVISPEECEAYFRSTIRMRERTISELTTAGRQVLDVAYEQDVLANLDETLRRIQVFVGTSPITLKKILQKQSSGPVSERVQNYSELCLHFENTPFRSFFGEEGQ